MKYLIILMTVVNVGCVKDLSTGLDFDPPTLYDEFWEYVDENYIYFDEKQVDWDSVYIANAQKLIASTTEEQLFDIMVESLMSLKDGHNALRSPSKVGAFYDFRNGYNVQFSAELVDSAYLSAGFEIDGNYTHGVVADSIYYIRIDRMQQLHLFMDIYRENLDSNIKGLVIDVRSNGGGDSNLVPTLLGDFVDSRTHVGSYIEKSGPNRADETDPIRVFAEPNSQVHFDQEIVVLTNRGSYSASSYMAAMFKAIPSVTLVGQVTGGGGGGNSNFELSNGWIVSVSVSDFLDAAGRSIEHGVEPDYEINNTSERLGLGIDDMLDKAIELLND